MNRPRSPAWAPGATLAVLAGLVAPAVVSGAWAGAADTPGCTVAGCLEWHDVFHKDVDSRDGFVDFALSPDGLALYAVVQSTTASLNTATSLLAYDAADGTVLWTQFHGTVNGNSPGPHSVNLSFDGDRFYVASRYGPASGFHLDNPRPAPAGGILRDARVGRRPCRALLAEPVPRCGQPQRDHGVPSPPRRGEDRQPLRDDHVVPRQERPRRRPER